MKNETVLELLGYDVDGQTPDQINPASATPLIARKRKIYDEGVEPADEKTKGKKSAEPLANSLDSLKKAMERATLLLSSLNNRQ